MWARCLKREEVVAFTVRTSSRNHDGRRRRLMLKHSHTTPSLFSSRQGIVYENLFNESQEEYVRCQRRKLMKHAPFTISFRFHVFTHCLLWNSSSPLLCSSKYSIDLTLQDHHEGSHLVRKAPAPPGMESWLQEEHKALSSGSSSTTRPPALSQSKQNQLVAKKTQMAMAIAMKPG